MLLEKYLLDCFQPPGSITTAPYDQNILPIERSALPHDFNAIVYLGSPLDDKACYFTFGPAFFYSKIREINYQLGLATATVYLSPTVISTITVPLARVRVLYDSLAYNAVLYETVGDTSKGIAEDTSVLANSSVALKEKRERAANYMNLYINPTKMSQVVPSKYQPVKLTKRMFHSIMQRISRHNKDQILEELKQQYQAAQILYINRALYFTDSPAYDLTLTRRVVSRSHFNTPANTFLTVSHAGNAKMFELRRHKFQLLQVFLASELRFLPTYTTSLHLLTMLANLHADLFHYCQLSFPNKLQARFAACLDRFQYFINGIADAEARTKHLKIRITKLEEYQCSIQSTVKSLVGSPYIYAVEVFVHSILPFGIFLFCVYVSLQLRTYTSNRLLQALKDTTYYLEKGECESEHDPGYKRSSSSSTTESLHVDCEVSDTTTSDDSIPTTPGQTTMQQPRMSSSQMSLIQGLLTGVSCQTLTNLLGTDANFTPERLQQIISYARERNDHMLLEALHYILLRIRRDIVMPINTPEVYEFITSYCQTVPESPSASNEDAQTQGQEALDAIALPSKPFMLNSSMRTATLPTHRIRKAATMTFKDPHTSYTLSTVYTTAVHAYSQMLTHSLEACGYTDYYFKLASSAQEISFNSDLLFSNSADFAEYFSLKSQLRIIPPMKLSLIYNASAQDIIFDPPLQKANKIFQPIEYLRIYLSFLCPYVFYDFNVNKAFKLADFCSHQLQEKRLQKTLERLAGCTYEFCTDLQSAELVSVPLPQAQHTPSQTTPDLTSPKESAHSQFNSNHLSDLAETPSNTLTVKIAIASFNEKKLDFYTNYRCIFLTDTSNVRRVLSMPLTRSLISPLGQLLAYFKSMITRITATTSRFLSILSATASVKFIETLKPYAPDSRITFEEMKNFLIFKEEDVIILPNLRFVKEFIDELSQIQAEVLAMKPKIVHSFSASTPMHDGSHSPSEDEIMVDPAQSDLHFQPFLELQSDCDSGPTSTSDEIICLGPAEVNISIIRAQILQLLKETTDTIKNTCNSVLLNFICYLGSEIHSVHSLFLSFMLDPELLKDVDHIKGYLSMSRLQVAFTRVFNSINTIIDQCSIPLSTSLFDSISTLVAHIFQSFQAISAEEQKTLQQQRNKAMISKLYDGAIEFLRPFANYYSGTSQQKVSVSFPSSYKPDLFLRPQFDIVLGNSENNFVPIRKLRTIKYHTTKITEFLLICDESGFLTFNKILSLSFFSSITLFLDLISILQSTSSDLAHRIYIYGRFISAAESHLHMVTKRFIASTAEVLCLTYHSMKVANDSASTFEQENPSLSTDVDLSILQFDFHLHELEASNCELNLTQDQILGYEKEFILSLALKTALPIYTINYSRESLFGKGGGINTIAMGNVDYSFLLDTTHSTRSVLTVPSVAASAESSATHTHDKTSVATAISVDETINEVDAILNSEIKFSRDIRNLKRQSLAIHRVLHDSTLATTGMLYRRPAIGKKTKGEFDIVRILAELRFILQELCIIQSVVEKWKRFIERELHVKKDITSTTATAEAITDTALSYTPYSLLSTCLPLCSLVINISDLVALHENNINSSVSNYPSYTLLSLLAQTISLIRVINIRISQPEQYNFSLSDASLTSYTYGHDMATMGDKNTASTDQNTDGKTGTLLTSANILTLASVPLTDNLKRAKARIPISIFKAKQKEKDKGVITLTYAAWTEYTNYAQEIIIAYATPITIMYLVNSPHLCEHHYQVLADLTGDVQETASETKEAVNKSSSVLPEASETSTLINKDHEIDPNSVHNMTVEYLMIMKDRYTKIIQQMATKRFLECFEEDKMLFSVLICIVNNAIIDMEARKQLNIIDDLLHNIIVESCYDMAIEVSNRTSTAWNSKSIAVLITPVNTEALLHESLYTISTILRNVGHGDKKICAELSPLECIYSHISHASSLRTTRHLPPKYKKHKHIIQQTCYAADIEVFARYLECSSWLILYIHKALFRITHVVYALLCITMYGTCITIDQHNRLYSLFTSHKDKDKLDQFFSDGALKISFMSHDDLVCFKQLMEQWKDLASRYLSKPFTALFSLAFDRDFNTSVTNLSRRLNIIYDKILSVRDSGILKNLQLINSVINPTAHIEVYYEVATSNPQLTSRVSQRIVPLYNNHYHPSFLFFCNTPILYCGEFLIRRSCFKAIQSLNIEVLSGVDDFRLLPQSPPVIVGPPIEPSGPPQMLVPPRQLVALESADETLELIEPIELPKSVFLVPDKIIENIGPALLRDVMKAWEEFNKQIQKYEHFVAAELNKLKQERATPGSHTKHHTDSVSFKVQSFNTKLRDKKSSKIGSDDSESDDTNAIERSLSKQTLTTDDSRTGDYSRSDNYKDLLENDPHLVNISESDTDSSALINDGMQQETLVSSSAALTPQDIISIQIQCCSIFDVFFSQFLFRSIVIILSTYIRLVYSKEIGEAFAGKHTKESMLPLLTLLKSFGKAIELEVICAHKSTLHKKAVVAKLHEWFELLSECKRIFMKTKGMALISSSVHFPFIYFQPGANKLFLTSEHGTYSFEASRHWLGAATNLDAYMKLTPRQLNLLNKIFTAISERMVIFLVCSSEKGHSNPELYLIITALSRYMLMRVIYCPFNEYTFAANMQRLSSAIASGCLAIVVGIEYLPSWQLLQLCTLANDLRIKIGALPGLLVMDKKTGSTRPAMMSDFPNLGILIFFLPELCSISCLENVHYVDPIDTITSGADTLLPILGQPSLHNESSYLTNNVIDYYSFSYTSSERLDLVAAPFKIKRLISLEIDTPDTLYLKYSPEYGRTFYEISVFLRQFNGFTYRLVAGDIPTIYAHVKERTDALCMAAITLDLIMRQTLSFILQPMTNDSLVEVYSRIVSSAFGLDKVSTTQLYRLSRAYWDFIKASLFSLNLLHDHNTNAKLRLTMGYNAATATQSVVHSRATFNKYFMEHLSKYMAPRFYNYITLFGQMHQLTSQFVNDVIFANELLKTGRPLLAIVPQSSYIRAYTAVLSSVKHWDVSYVVDSRSLQAALKRMVHEDSTLKQKNAQETLAKGKASGDLGKPMRLEHLVVIAPSTSHTLLQMMDQLLGASLYYPIIMDEFSCTYYHFEIGHGPYFMICVSISMLHDLGSLIDIFTHRVVLLPSIEGSDGCRKILHGSLIVDAPYLKSVAKLNVDIWKSELKLRRVDSPDILLFLRELESCMLPMSGQLKYLARVVQRISVLPTFLSSIIGFLYDTMTHVFSCSRSVDEVFLLRSMFYFFLLRFNVVSIARRPLDSSFLHKNFTRMQQSRGETPNIMRQRIAEIANYRPHEDGCSPMAFTGTFAFNMVFHVRECAAIMMRMKEAMALQQKQQTEQGSSVPIIAPSLPEPFGMTLEQRAQVPTFFDAMGIIIPPILQPAMNIYYHSSSTFNQLKKQSPSQAELQSKNMSSLTKQNLQLFHKAFYSSFTSTAHTILADEVWPFLDVAGFSLQEIQDLDNHVKQKSSGNTNLTSVINTALLLNAQREVLQLGLGFCGSLSFELNSNFVRDAIFCPESHTDAFVNLVVPLVVALWNACSLFVTTYGDGRTRITKGLPSYTRWLGKKYATIMTELQNIERLTQAIYCGISPLITLLLLESGSPLVNPDTLRHFNTGSKLDLNSLNHGLSHEAIINNFRAFSKKVVTVLPPEFPISASSPAAQNYNHGTIINSGFSYIDFSYGLGQNKKLLTYKKYICKAEFRLYELGHGVLKKVHEMRDKSLLEKDIETITTHFVEKKKNDLKSAKDKVTKEHARLIHAKEDVLFTKLITTTKDGGKEAEQAQEASRLLKLVKTSNDDFYMSSSDEENHVHNDVMSTDPTKGEPSSSMSEGTDANLENVKRHADQELRKLSKLSKAERAAIELELLDYDRGESVSIQCSNSTISVFSPHHCAIIVALGCAMLSPVTVALIGQRGSGKTRLLETAWLLFRDLVSPDTFLFKNVHTENSIHTISSSIASRCLQRNYLTAAESRRNNAYIGLRDDVHTVLDYNDSLCFPSIHLHCSDVDSDTLINGHLALLLRDHLLFLDANMEVNNPVYLDIPYNLRTGAMSLSDISIIVECTPAHSLVNFCGLQIEAPPYTESYLIGLCKKIFPQQTDSWISQYVNGYFLVRGSLPTSISETYAIFSNMFQNFIMTINSITVVPDKMLPYIREEEECIRTGNYWDANEYSTTTILKYNSDQLLLRASLHSLFSSFRTMAQMDAQLIDAVIERFASLSFLGYLDTDEEYVASVKKTMVHERLEKAKKSNFPISRQNKTEIRKSHQNLSKRTDSPWSDVKLMLISKISLYPAWEAFVINHSIRLGNKASSFQDFMGMLNIPIKTTPFVKENALLMPSTLYSPLCQIDGILTDASELLSLSHASINAFWFAHFLLLTSKLPVYDPYMLSRVFHLFITVRAQKEMNVARFTSIINHCTQKTTSVGLSGFHDSDPFHGTRIYLANRAAPYAGKIHVYTQNTTAMRTGKQPAYIDQEVREYLLAIGDSETYSWRKSLRKQTASLVIDPETSLDEEMAQRMTMKAQPKVDPNQATIFPGFSLASMMCLRPTKYSITVSNGTLQCYAEIISQLLVLSGFQKFSLANFTSIYTSTTQQQVLLDAASIITNLDPLNGYFIEQLTKVGASTDEYEFLLLLLMLRTAVALSLGVKPEALYPAHASPLNPVTGLSFRSSLETFLPSRTIGMGRALSLLPPAINSWSGLRGKSHKIIAREKQENALKFLLPSNHDVIVIAPKSALSRVGLAGVSVYELLARTIEPLNSAEGLFSLEEMSVLCALVAQSYNLDITCDRRMLASFLSLNLSIIVVDDLPVGPTMVMRPDKTVHIVPQLYSEHMRIPVLTAIKSPAIEMNMDIEEGLSTLKLQRGSISEEHLRDMQHLLLSNSNLDVKREEYKMNLIHYSFNDIVSIYIISRCRFPNEPPAHVFRKGNTQRTEFLTLFKHTFAAATLSIYKFASRFTVAPTVSLMRFTNVAAQITNLVYNRLGQFFRHVDILITALFFYEHLAAPSKTKPKIIDVSKLTVPVMIKIVENAVSSVDRHTGATKMIQKGFVPRNHNAQMAVAEAVIMRDFLHSLLTLLKREILVMEAVVQTAHLDSILCAAYIVFSETDRLPEETCLQCLINGECGDLSLYLLDLLAKCQQPDNNKISPFTVAMISVLTTNGIPLHIHTLDKTIMELLKDPLMISIAAETTGKGFFLDHVVRIMAASLPTYIILKVLNVEWKPGDIARQTLDCVALMDSIDNRMHVVPSYLGLSAAYLLEGIHRGKRLNSGYLQELHIAINVPNEKQSQQLVSEFSTNILKLDLLLPPNEFAKTLDSYIEKSKERLKEIADVAPGTDHWYKYKYLVLNFGAPNVSTTNISLLRKLYLNRDPGHANASIIFVLYPGVDFTTACVRAGMLTQTALDTLSCSCLCSLSRENDVTNIDLSEFPAANAHRISCMLIESIFGENSAGRSSDECTRVGNAAINLLLENFANAMQSYFPNFIPSCNDMQTLRILSSMPVETSHQQSQSLSYCLKPDSPLKKSQEEAIATMFSLGHQLALSATGKYTLVDTLIKNDINMPDIDKEINITCLQRAIVNTTGTAIAQKLGRSLSLVLEILWRYAQVHSPAIVLADDNFMPDLHLRISKAVAQYTAMIAKENATKPEKIPPEQLKAQGLMSMRHSYPFIYAMKQNPVKITSFLAACILPYINDRAFRLFEPRIAAGVITTLSIFFIANLNIFEQDSATNKSTSMERSLGITIIGRKSYADLNRLIMTQQLANCFLASSRFPLTKIYTKTQYKAILKFSHVTELIPEICSVSPRVTYAWLVVTVLARYNTIIAEALPWFVQHHSSFVSLALTENPFLAIMAFYAQRNPNFELKGPDSEWLKSQVYQEATKKHTVINLPPNLLEPSGSVIFAIYCMSVALRPQTLAYTSNACICFMHSLVGSPSARLYQNSTSTAYFGATGVTYNRESVAFLAKATAAGSDMREYSIASAPSIRKQLLSARIEPNFSDLVRLCSEEPESFKFSEKLISDSIYSLEELCEVTIKQLRHFQETRALDAIVIERAPLIVSIIFYDSCIAAEILLEYVITLVQSSLSCKPVPIKLVRSPALNDLRESIVIVTVETALSGYSVINHLTYILSQKDTLYRSEAVYPLFVLVPSSLSTQSIFIPGKVGGIDSDPSFQYNTAMALSQLISAVKPNFFYLRSPSTMIGGFTHSLCLSIAILRNMLLRVLGKTSIDALDRRLHFSISLRGLSLLCLRQAFLFTRDTISASDYDIVNTIGSCLLKALSTAKHQKVNPRNFGHITMLDSAYFKHNLDLTRSIFDTQYLAKFDECMEQVLFARQEALQKIFITKLVLTEIETYDKTLMRQLKEKMKAKKNDAKRAKEQDESSSYSDESDDVGSMDQSAKSSMFDGDSLSDRLSDSRSFRSSRSNRYSSRSSAVSGVSEAFDDFDDSVSQTPSSVSKMSGTSIQSTTLFRMADGGTTFAQAEDNIYNFLLMGIQMIQNCLDQSKLIDVNAIEQSVSGIMQPKRRNLVVCETPNMIYKKLERYEKHLVVTSTEAAQNKTLSNEKFSDNNSETHKGNADSQIIKDDTMSLLLELASKNGEGPKKENIKQNLIIPMQIAKMSDLMSLYGQLIQYDTMRHVFFNEPGISQKDKDHLLVSLGQNNLNTTYRLSFSSHFLTDTICRFLHIEKKSKIVYQISDMKAMPQSFKTYLINLSNYNGIRFSFPGIMLSGDVLLNGLLPSTFSTSALKLITGQYGFGSFTDHWIISGAVYYKVLGDILNYLRVISSIMTTSPLVRQKVVILLKKPTTMPRIMEDGNIFIEKAPTNPRPVFYIIIRNMELLGVSYDPILDTICDLSPERAQGFSSCFDLYACCAIIDDTMGSKEPSLTKRHMRLPKNIVPVPLKIGGYCVPIVYMPNRTEIPSEEWRTRHPCFVAKTL